jgi:hypothetical protein
VCVTEGGKVIFNEFLSPDVSDVFSTSRGVMGVELEIYGARNGSFLASRPNFTAS